MKQLDLVKTAILGQELLLKMKSTSILINVAIGCALDEIALYYLLKSNKLTGVAIDVFSQEPY